MSRAAIATALAISRLAASLPWAGVGAAQSTISAAQYQYGKKVTICHKGKTISVGRAAERAHAATATASERAERGRRKAKKAKAAKAAAAKAKAKASSEREGQGERAAKKQDKSEEPAITPARGTARVKAEKARSPHSYDSERPGTSGPLAVLA